MVRPKKLGRNFVPPNWISESESEDDLGSYHALKRPRICFNIINPQSDESESGSSRGTYLQSSVPCTTDTEYDSTVSNNDELQLAASIATGPSDVDPSFDSESEPEYCDLDSSNRYDDFLSEITKMWLLIELHHTVSKAASDAFWQVAMHYFPELFRLKEEQRMQKKTPQFTHIRRKLMDMHLPKIQMELGYRNKKTGVETHIVSDVAPRNQFPKSDFEPIYEIATVQVINDLVKVGTSRYYVLHSKSSVTRLD